MDRIISITTYNRMLAKDKNDAWEKIKRINLDYTSGNSIHWGIFENENNTIIGTCGYYRGFENNRGELGCVLLPEYRGKGFMKAALKLAIEFGYNTLKLKEIFALTDNDNSNSIQLLKSLNFIFTANKNENDIEMIHQKKN